LCLPCNRWGRSVASRDITLNPELISRVSLWDGIMPDGKPATEGVYFYSITAKNKKNKAVGKNGSVEVLR